MAIYIRIISETKHSQSQRKLKLTGRADLKGCVFKTTTAHWNNPQLDLLYWDFLCGLVSNTIKFCESSIDTRRGDMFQGIKSDI